jgi:hypothetical protein
VWSAWHAIRKPGGIGGKVANILIALAVLDIVWIGVAFKMIGWSVDY